MGKQLPEVMEVMLWSGLRNEYAQPRRDFANEVPYSSGELVRIFPHDPEATRRRILQHLQFLPPQGDLVARRPTF